MLLLDGEKISAKDFCDKFNIDYANIVKNPVFEVAGHLKSIDRANNNVTKVPARIAINCKTFIRDKHGQVLELRYAQNRNIRIIKKERVEVFTPRYVYLDAEKSSFKGDVDLAVFMFANAEQFGSPFGNQKDFTYVHVDPKVRALNKLNSLSNVSKAMAIVNEMPEDELVILSKGIAASFERFNPFVDGEDTDIETLRVEMLTFAQLNADDFLESVGNKISKTKGQIVNLVDKGIVKITTSQSIRQWKWDSGERKGQPIGNQIVDPHVNATEYLLNYMLSNLAEYYDAIHSVNTSISSEAQALKFLQSKKEQEAANEEEFANMLILPNTFDECRRFMEERGFKKIPGDVKRLEEAIKSGVVKQSNVIGFLNELQPKK